MNIQNNKKDLQGAKKKDSITITKNVEKVRFALRGHEGQKDQRHDGLDGLHIAIVVTSDNDLVILFNILRNGISPAKFYDACSTDQ